MKAAVLQPRENEPMLLNLCFFLFATVFFNLWSLYLWESVEYFQEVHEKQLTEASLLSVGLNSLFKDPYFFCKNFRGLVN